MDRYNLTHSFTRDVEGRPTYYKIEIEVVDNRLYSKLYRDCDMIRTYNMNCVNVIHDIECVIKELKNGVA